MKKLNRSKLLSLVTVGAIVVTTAFSFAAWDTLDKTVSGGTLSIRDKVVVSSASTPTFTGTQAVGTEITDVEYTSLVNFGVANSGAVSGYQLKVTPIIDGLTENTDYTYTVSNGADDVTAGDATVEASNDYTVKVNLVDNATVQGKAGASLNISMKGELVKAP